MHLLTWEQLHTLDRLREANPGARIAFLRERSPALRVRLSWAPGKSTTVLIRPDGSRELSRPKRLDGVEEGGERA